LPHLPHRHPSVQFLHDQTHPQEHSGHEGFGQLKHDPLLQHPPLSQQDDWHLKQEGCPLQHDNWHLKHSGEEHLRRLKQPVHRGQEQSAQLQLGLQSQQLPEHEPHPGLHSPHGLQPLLQPGLQLQLGRLQVQQFGLLQLHWDLQHDEVLKQPQPGLQHEGILKQLQLGLQQEQFGSQHEQSKHLGLLHLGKHWQEQQNHEAHTHTFDLQEKTFSPNLSSVLSVS
jgi:hypothetical protein